LFFCFVFSLGLFVLSRGTAGNPARYNAESWDFSERIDPSQVKPKRATFLDSDGVAGAG
jgi:hypothetical protein